MLHCGCMMKMLTVIKWGHSLLTSPPQFFYCDLVFLESKYQHLQGVLSSCGTNARQFGCFNAEYTRDIWSPVLFPSDCYKIVHRLSPRGNVKLQSPVQQTDFTGLCFQLLLLIDTVSSCLSIAYFCSPFHFPLG